MSGVITEVVSGADVNAADTETVASKPVKKARAKPAAKPTTKTAAKTAAKKTVSKAVAKSTSKPVSKTAAATKRVNKPVSKPLTKPVNSSAAASTVVPKTASATTSAGEALEANKATNTCIQGEITGLYNGYLQGWAYDASNPDLCLAIEVCFDGVYGQLVRADEFVMHAPEAAQMHGFTVELKPHWLANAKRVSARVANQGPWLEGSIDLAKISEAEQD